MVNGKYKLDTVIWDPFQKHLPKKNWQENGCWNEKLKKQKNTYQF